MKTELEEAAKKYSGIAYDRDDYEEKYYNPQGCDKYDAFIDGAKYQAEKMYTEEDMIEFANWLRKEDTEENAEKYCNHSDSDMLQVFKDQQIKTLYYE